MRLLHVAPEVTPRTRCGEIFLGAAETAAECRREAQAFLEVASAALPGVTIETAGAIARWSWSAGRPRDRPWRAPCGGGRFGLP